MTETPPVEQALNSLRKELGTDHIELGELVILGAQAKLERVRGARGDTAARRGRLANRVRAGDLPVDIEAADQVRRAGWTR